MISTRSNKLLKLELEISSLPLRASSVHSSWMCDQLRNGVQDHLEGAIHIALSQLLGRIGELSTKAPLTVLCGSGYRSSIAASLLESKGSERLTNVTGGMQAVRFE